MSKKKSRDVIVVILVLLALASYWFDRVATTVGGLLMIAAVVSIPIYLGFVSGRRKMVSEEKERAAESKLASVELSQMQARRDEMMRLSNQFRKSTDYSMITNFVMRYQSELFGHSAFNNLVRVINTEWGLDTTTIKQMVSDEAARAENEAFRTKMKLGNPVVFDDYIKRATEAFGENLKVKLPLLHQFLIDENVIHPQTPLFQTESAVNVLFHKIAKERLLAPPGAFGFRNIMLVDELTPIEFESLVAELYERNGYKATLTKTTGDQGADVVLEKLGEKVVVQVKLYSSAVGNKAIQEITAAQRFYKASRGIVVTNNYFTSSAIELAIANDIELVNRVDLEKLLS